MVAGTRERNLQRARAALGDPTADELLSQGATMTYDEIIEYAVDQLDASGPSPSDRSGSTATG